MKYISLTIHFYNNGKEHARKINFTCNEKAIPESVLLMYESTSKQLGIDLISWILEDKENENR